MCFGRKVGPSAPLFPVGLGRVATPRTQLKDRQVFLRQQNCQGLKTDAKLKELAYSFKASRSFACAVQETWRKGKEVFDVGGVSFILSGPEQQTGRGSKGLGFVLSAKAFQLWELAGSFQVTSVDQRSFGIRVAAKDSKGRDVGLFLVCCYAPVGCAPEAEWQQFFAGWDQVLKSARSGDIVVSMGDYNSSMGINVQCSAADIDTEESRTRAVDSSGGLGPFGSIHCNEAGRRLHSHIGSRGMVTCSTMFRKRQYNTWTHPCSRLGHQIDHFFVHKEDWKRVRDCGYLSQLVNSDHGGIGLRLELEMRMEKRVTSNILTTVDHNSLVGKEEEQVELKKQFCTEVEKQMKLLQSESNLNKAELLEKAMSAASSILPKKQRKSPLWFEASIGKIRPAIEQRNSAIRALHANPTCSLLHYAAKKRRKALRDIIAQAKSQWVSEWCTKVNTLHGKAVWDAIKELKAALSGKVPPKPQVKMRKSGGGYCTSPEENAEAFKAFFEPLYGRTADVDESVLQGIKQQEVLMKLENEPDLAEVITAVKRLNNSAPGESGISAQMVKALIANTGTVNMIHGYVIEFWETETAPASWLSGILKVLPKKGDLGLPKNWRGIMLGEVLYKVVSTILFLRLEVISEKLPHESQVGFRPQRGARDGIFTVKQAFRKRCEHGLDSRLPVCALKQQCH